MILSLSRAHSPEEKYNSNFKGAILHERHVHYAVEKESCERLPDELRFSEDMTFIKGLEVRIEVQHEKKGEPTFSAKGIT